MNLQTALKQYAEAGDWLRKSFGKNASNLMSGSMTIEDCTVYYWSMDKMRVFYDLVERNVEPQNIADRNFYKGILLINCGVPLVYSREGYTMIISKEAHDKDPVMQIFDNKMKVS